VQKRIYILIVVLLAFLLATFVVMPTENTEETNTPAAEQPPTIIFQPPDEIEPHEEYNNDEDADDINEVELYMDRDIYEEYEDTYFEIYSIFGTADSVAGDMWERMERWRYDAVLLSQRHRDTVIINMNPNENVVYLTFDDGPDPVNTVSVINTLIEHDVSATFFFLGENIRHHPEVVLMAYEAGFTIGLHGYTHTSFRSLSEDEIIAELERTNDLLESITGSRATTMRPPYGAIGDDEVDVIRSQDLLIYLWSLDTLDWAQRDANEILRNIQEYTRPGEIILMHAFSGQRLVPEILPEIIEFLRDEGFEMRALP